MGFPRSVIDRVHHQGDLIGLKLAIGSSGLSRLFWFRADDEEFAKLEDYSIGQAAPASAQGTGWNEVLKAGTNSSWLEPAFQGQLYQFWWGVEPSIAFIYTQYPPGQNRESLQGNWSVGDQVGYINGRDSPPDAPDPVTETFSLYGAHPAYNGYHPRGEPMGITVRMSFWIQKLNVYLETVTKPGDPRPTVPGITGRVGLHTVGGLWSIGMPPWLEAIATRRFPGVMSPDSQPGSLIPSPDGGAVYGR